MADVFISHASEDKEDIARPLAEALTARGYDVWYDEYILRLGDSLRQEIDRGLAACRYGVVILSPDFFAKQWTQRELDGLVARETSERTKRIIPVLHNMDYHNLVSDSPTLAGRLFVSTDRGLDAVVEAIVDVLDSRERLGAKAVLTQRADNLLELYYQHLEGLIGKVHILGDLEEHDLTRVFVHLTIIEERLRPSSQTQAEYWGLMDSELRNRRYLFAGDADEGSTPGMVRAEPEWANVNPDELLSAETRVVLVGAPGSGKSTLLRYLAYKTLQQGDRLSIFLELKRITEIDFATEKDRLEDLIFEKSVAEPLRLNGVDRANLKRVFLDKLRAGNVAIFLDGLDEVSGTKYFPRLRQAVKEFVHSVHRHNNLIISTRPYALRDRYSRDEMREMEIAPLNEQQIEQFVNHYYGSDPKAKKFVTELPIRRELRELASLPALLGFLVRLRRDQDGIANSRTEVYRQLVQALVTQFDDERSVERKFKVDDPDGFLKHDFLKHLAYSRLLERESAKVADRLIFTGEDLLKAAKEYCRQEGLQERPNLLAADVKATALLREIGADVYAFAHLTIQEYFAAVALSERKDHEQIFCRAYFNPTLAEMEVLPMALGLARKPDDLFIALEQLPDSLSFTGLRLQVRGLAYGAKVSQPLVEKLIDQLIRFISLVHREDTPYADSVIKCFYNVSVSTQKLITNRLTTLLAEHIDPVRSIAAVVLWNMNVGDGRAVSALVQALKNENVSVRSNAAWILGRIGDKRAVNALIEALKDTDHIVQRCAVRALAQIGDQRAIGPLFQIFKNDDSLRYLTQEALTQFRSERTLNAALEVLRDDDSDVRASAAWVLGQIGDEHAVGGLVTALSDEHREVRRQVAGALCRIGNEQAIDELVRVLMDTGDRVLDATDALESIGDERAVRVLEKAIQIHDQTTQFNAAWVLKEIGDERAVKALIQALKGDSRVGRWIAARTLMRIRTTYAVSALVEALEDDDLDVRLSVTAAFGQSDGEGAISILAKALNDDYREVRTSAVLALNQIGNERAVDALVEALRSEYSDVRMDAAEVLWEIGDERALKVLNNALKDDNVDVRWRANRIFRVGNEHGIAALIKALRSEDRVVRGRMAAALVRSGEDGVLFETLREMGSDTQSSLVATLVEGLNDDDKDVHWYSIKGLVQLGGDDVVSAVITALKEGDRLVRSNAAKALGQIGDKRAVDELVDLLKDDDRNVQVSAAEALGQIGDKSAVSGLIEALNVDDGSVRQNVVVALGQIGDKRALNALIEAIKDDDSYVRRGAAEALGHLGGRRAVSALIVALKDKDSMVRRDAAEALGQIGAKRGANALVERLDDKGLDVRWRAAESLWKIGDERAADTLVEALKHSSHDVWKGAAEVLTQTGGDRAVRVLIEVLTDSSLQERRHIANLLAQISDERAVSSLLKALKSDNAGVRQDAAEVLERLNDEALINGLLLALASNDSFVRSKAAAVIGYYAAPELSCQVSEVLSVLADNDPAAEVKNAAIEALKKFECKQQYFKLLSAAENLDASITSGNMVVHH